VMKKAFILVRHAEDAADRGEARARVREAMARVEDQPARKWLARRAAQTCKGAGIYDDAFEWFALARELNAEDPRALVDIESERAIALVETNRIAEGEEVLKGALRIAESIPRPNVYSTYPLLQLAKLALEKHDLAAAEANLARVDAIMNELVGAKTAVGILPRATQVRLLCEQGEAARAETLAVASIDAAEEYGLYVEAQYLREELAEIMLARGDANAAVEQLRAILELPSRSPMRARVYSMLARAQRANGRDADAVSSLRAAAALVDGSLAGDHPLRIEVERELATLTAAVPYR